MELVKNEDSSVISLCVNDTFHSAPHRTVNDWHRRKSYHMADVNESEYSSSLLFLPPPLLSSRCCAKHCPWQCLNTPYHSSLSRSPAPISFILTPYLKSLYNFFFFCRNTFTPLYSSQRRRNSLMLFFLAVVTLKAFLFYSDRLASSDPFRNKKQMISHPSHCYFLVIDIFPLLWCFFLVTTFSLSMCSALNRFDSETYLRHRSLKLVVSNRNTEKELCVMTAEDYAFKRKKKDKKDYKVSFMQYTCKSYPPQCSRDFLPDLF